MKRGRIPTTAGAATAGAGAGAAAGSIVAWAVGAPGEITGAFATLGAFLFSVYLPRPRR